MDRMKKYVDKQRLPPQQTAAARQNTTNKVVGIGCTVGAVLIGSLLMIGSQHREGRTVDDTPVADPEVAIPIENARGADWLEPAVRFNNYKPDDQRFAVQQALNDGDVLTAMELFGAPDAIANPDDIREIMILEAIEVAADRQGGIDRGVLFVFRVREYWLRELQNIIDSKMSASSVSRTLESFGEAQRRLKDIAHFDFSDEQQESFDTYASKLREAQTSAYPRIRKATADELRSRLFRENIDVELRGARADRLVFTSYLYANNANIEDHFDALGEVEALRVKKVTFRPYDRGREDTYTLDTPQDEFVAALDD